MLRSRSPIVVVQLQTVGNMWNWGKRASTKFCCQGPVNTEICLVYQNCQWMWYLCLVFIYASVIQRLTILEHKNDLVLSNIRVPVSGTWSILFLPWWVWRYIAATPTCTTLQCSTCRVPLAYPCSWSQSLWLAKYVASQKKLGTWCWVFVSLIGNSQV